MSSVQNRLLSAMVRKTNVPRDLDLVKSQNLNISLTVDVESHGSADDYEFSKILDDLIVRLEQRNIRATFFVNGSVIFRWEKKIVELYKAGHHIGSHGWSHVPLAVLGEAKSKEEINRCYYEISSLIGSSSALGFRAPYFSLTEETPWAPNLIFDAGFSYSSSVLPGRNPQFAYRNSPLLPFKWQNGLPEFPVPTLNLFGFTCPAIGGGYLRVLPKSLINRFLERSKDQVGLWTYCHPYDFAGALHMPKSPSWMMRRILAMRRQLMMPRLLEIVNSNAPSMKDLVSSAEFINSLHVFSSRKEE